MPTATAVAATGGTASATIAGAADACAAAGGAAAPYGATASDASADPATSVATPSESATAGRATTDVAIAVDARPSSATGVSSGCPRFAAATIRAAAEPCSAEPTAAAFQPACTYADPASVTSAIQPASVARRRLARLAEFPI